MRTIHKFGPLRPLAATVVEMPVGARVVHVGEQRGELYIWATVDDSRPKCFRAFMVVGTGLDLDEIAQPSIPHIGTVAIGPYVWHVFGAEDRDS